MGKSPLTRTEREKKVYQALLEGKPVREISKEFHVSFTYIGEIRRKYGMAEPETVKLSIRSKALKMMEEGKTNFDVATQLNLSANEALEYRKEYMTLKNEDDFLRIYPEIKDVIPDLLILIRELKIEEISPDEAVFALADNKTFEQMQFQYECLLKLISPLRQEAEALHEEKKKVKEEISDLEAMRKEINQEINLIKAQYLI